MNWTIALDNLLDEIYRRHPASQTFRPKFGAVIAVIPRAHFNPDVHYLIDDAALLARAQVALRDTIYSNYDGPDAVLILGSCV